MAQLLKVGLQHELISRLFLQLRKPLSARVFASSANSVHPSDCFFLLTCMNEMAASSSTWWIAVWAPLVNQTCSHCNYIASVHLLTLVTLLKWYYTHPPTLFAPKYLQELATLGYQIRQSIQHFYAVSHQALGLCMESLHLWIVMTGLA